MDSIDPLNTIEPQAPHSSTFSSNQYLTKPSSTELKPGTLSLVIEDSDLTEGAWWAAVGIDVASENFDMESLGEAKGHLNGFRLNLSEEFPRAYLTEDPKNNVFVKLYGVHEEEALKRGVKIGEHKAKPIYGVLKEPSECTASTSDLYDALCRVFKYDPSIINFYIYHHTGRISNTTAPLETDLDPLDQEAQYLDLRSMIK